MAMNLAVPMPFKVIDPVAGQVATGTGSVVNFKPGQTVMLSFPQSRRTPVDDDQHVWNERDAEYAYVAPVPLVRQLQGTSPGRAGFRLQRAG